MPSNYLILCQPLLLLPSVFPRIRVFSKDSALCIKWTNFGALTSASVLPMNIQDWSFRMDWFDLLDVQGTLKNLLQYHNSKLSILWHAAFSMIQLSHPYMTIGKAIALTIWTSISKMMSLLFNTLSRLVLAFLPRSKCLLISWMQSPSTVILEPPKI